VNVHAHEHDLDQLFSGQRLLAILRGLGRERSLELAGVAWDLGVRCVEVPIQGAADVDALEAVAAAGAARGFPVGAGTVVTAEHVATARRAGASFTVSPGLDGDVVRASLDAGLPTLPGVATAGEIQAAQRLGLTWVKAFPASVLTPAWFRAVRSPFPGLHLVATGGVDAGNAAAFLEAGADVVAVGSALASDDAPTVLGQLLAGPPARARSDEKPSR